MELEKVLIPPGPENNDAKDRLWPEGDREVHLRQNKVSKDHSHTFYGPDSFDIERTKDKEKSSPVLESHGFYLEHSD